MEIDINKFAQQVASVPLSLSSDNYESDVKDHCQKCYEQLYYNYPDDEFDRYAIWFYLMLAEYEEILLQLSSIDDSESEKGVMILISNFKMAVNCWLALQNMVLKFANGELDNNGLNKFNEIILQCQSMNCKWYITKDNTPAIYYLLSDTMNLIAMEIVNIKTSNCIFRKCENCNKLFATQKNNVKYCPTCSKNLKSILDKKRRDTPMGKRHTIATYMRNSGKFSESEICAFYDESELHLQKHNEDDSMQYLENKHKEFKQIAKTRK